MSASFNTLLTSDPNNPTYNFGIAETYSYVPVHGESLNRPLYARASYLVNPGDINSNPPIPGFAIPTYDTIVPTYYPGTTNYRQINYSYHGTLVASLSFSYLDASTNGSPFSGAVRLV
jgi:hypothetical protein